ncbi:t-SNARE [Polychytrium aggregatum]|uniref:t-SNARE n=1 Tax=Polychytrium aggregatum TaxID=110093 RepID=UPI0022FDC466|nr:t-SNARE [Polychytrium aggregatum]KAI9193687.1 t-SNARE [Polychytrium aggregatum]
MSFGDFDRASSSPRQYAINLQSAPSGLADSDGERSYSKMMDRSSHTIFMISNNVAHIQKYVSNFGTAKDSEDARKKLTELTNATRNMIKQTTIDLKNLSKLENDNRQRKMAHQKLQKDFEDVLGRFQSVSKLAAAKSREYVIRARALQHAEEEDENAGENQPLISQQQRLQIHAVESELQFNEALINERDGAIRQIEQSIVEVNEIFRDLGTIVNDQQHHLDNIESNVESVAINMEDATTELRTASQAQLRAQSRKCYLMILLGVIVVIFTIVIFS